MALKADQIATASPAVGAVGVQDSLQKDGSFGEYDVTISVTYSPKAGQMAIVNNKTIRMTAKKYAAFREDTNEFTGEDFLKEYFPKELKEALANAEKDKAPQVYVVNPGQPLVPQPANVAAKSSVETHPAFAGKAEKAEVTKAPAPPKQADYQAPGPGVENVTEGNVETPPYTNDEKPLNPSGLTIDEEAEEDTSEIPSTTGKEA